MNELLVIENKPDNFALLDFILASQTSPLKSLEHVALPARRDLREETVLDDGVGEVAGGYGGELDENTKGFVFLVVLKVGGSEELRHERVGGGVVADS